MSQKLDTSPAVIDIDIGKNSFHIVGQNQRGAIVLRQKWSRGQVQSPPSSDLKRPRSQSASC
jgi:transposase